MGKFSDNTLDKIEKIQIIYDKSYENLSESNIHDFRVSMRKIVPNFYFLEKNIENIHINNFIKNRKILKKEFLKFSKMRDYQVASIILNKFERDSFHNFDIRYMMAEREDELRDELINLMDRNVLENSLSSIKKFLSKDIDEIVIKDLPNKIELERCKFINLASVLNAEASTENFHIARIKLKKYRYFMEFSNEMGLYINENLIERVKNLQNEFGKLQDYDVLKGILSSHGCDESYVSFLEFEMEIQENIILDVLKLYLD